MKSKIFSPIFIISFLFIGNLKAQPGISIQSPNYFGGKGKQLTDIMFTASWEYFLKDRIGLNFGFGLMGKLAPNTYHGVVLMEKYDYGSFNQSLPDHIPVDYYYKQSGLGLQSTLDLRLYVKPLLESGPYFAVGAGFDFLTFKSHLDKYDDFNYVADRENYPETPSNMPTNLSDSTRKFTDGNLNLRLGVGYTIRINPVFMFFAECNVNYAPSAKNSKESLAVIYSRAAMISPTIGIKIADQ